MDVNIRGDFLTESFIEFRIAIEFLAERNYDYEILTHSLTHVDYLGQRLFVKSFFKDSLTNCVSGSFLTMKGGVGHEKYNEKYNESVLPNTAFINELKSKLPGFFNGNNQ